MFMANNLRTEYLVRECVPKVGRQNQGKEIVRECMPERQNVQFTLYLADSTNVLLHPCYCILQYSTRSSQVQVLFQPQPNTTIWFVFFFFDGHRHKC